MNIRKNIDYSAMYARINDAMLSDLSMMQRYVAIGYAVAERPEKGAAVAAAEYIQKNWPNEKGYSPRNLRRMRELYREYGDLPGAITLAEQIGWTQNVVILEAELDQQERLWYMRAVSQFGWSKLELLEMIKNAAHTEIVLDDGLKVCDNNEYRTEINDPMKAVKDIPAKLVRLIRQRCRGKPKIGVGDGPLCYVRYLRRSGSLPCDVGKEKIRFSTEDTLYILGDVINRGLDRMALLRETMEVPSMVVLLGNHEYKMLDYLKPDPDPIAKRRWNRNGNRPTLDAFLKLKARHQKENLAHPFGGGGQRLEVLSGAWLLWPQCP